MEDIVASMESLVCVELSWAHRLGCTQEHPSNQKAIVIPASWAGPWEVGKGQGRGFNLGCLGLLSDKRGLGGLEELRGHSPES